MSSTTFVCDYSGGTLSNTHGASSCLSLFFFFFYFGGGGDDGGGYYGQ